MIQIEEAILKHFIYHKFSLEDIEPELNETEYNLDQLEEENILLKFLLKPFTTASSTQEFKHAIDIELNPLYKISTQILAGGDFIENSKHIYQHLKTVSKHPNIKDGDLFICEFENVMLENKYYKALGIYKIENKENFLETSSYQANKPGLEIRKGIGSKRLDKACLIIFTEKPFTILVIDNAKTETDYWQNDFIKMDFKNDFVNNTNQFLNITKTFATKHYPAEFEIQKADQIDLLNRSVDYFKTHETFVKSEFETEVLQHDNLINSFNKFDQHFRAENKIEIEDDFSISKQALKKQEKSFKSVLKLDKNFHIYIHGDRELIEQGREQDGRKFYKIYYKEEN